MGDRLPVVGAGLPVAGDVDEGRAQAATTAIDPPPVNSHDPAEDPPDIHAACIYALSMSLEHRRKANAFFKERGGDNYTLIQEAWPGLAQSNLISIAARPGLSELWRRRQEGCDCQCEEGGAP